MADETALAGGRMFVQVHSRWIANVHVLRNHDALSIGMPVWREIRKLPLAEQEAGAAQPRDARASWSRRRTRIPTGPRAVGRRAAPGGIRWFFLHGSNHCRPIARSRKSRRSRARTRSRRLSTWRWKSISSNSSCRPLTNEDQEAVLEIMRHPRVGGDLLRFRRACLADHGLLDRRPIC